MKHADGPLHRGLAALRADSRRSPRPLPREQARAAMHEALAPNSSPMHRRILRRLLPRTTWPSRVRLGLAASTTVLAAAVVVGTMGWNAAPGTPLYGIRAARQSVQLALPGADVATLHLQFAEQDLEDARQGGRADASLAGAETELAAARAALPADRSSQAWRRYEADEAALAADQSQFEGGPARPIVPPPVTGHGTPTPEGSENGEMPPPAQSSGGWASPSPTERPEPSPSAGAGVGDGEGPAAPSPGGNDN